MNYLYLRVSRAEQVDGSSLDNQEYLLKQYCELKGLRPVEIIREEGYTGRNIKRPGFTELMTKVKKGDSVVVYSLSRFGRNTLDVLTAVRFFDENGITFHSLKENVDTNSAMGKFFLTVMAALQTFEADQISERVRDVKAYRKANKKVYSSAPFGFDIEGDNLIPNSEQMIVKKVLAMKGMPYNKIAGELNATGLTTKKGKQFQATTIKRILTNTIYATD